MDLYGILPRDLQRKAKFQMQLDLLMQADTQLFEALRQVLDIPKDSIKPEQLVDLLNMLCSNSQDSYHKMLIEKWLKDDTMQVLKECANLELAKFILAVKTGVDTHELISQFVFKRLDVYREKISLAEKIIAMENKRLECDIGDFSFIPDKDIRECFKYKDVGRIITRADRTFANLYYSIIKGYSKNNRRGWHEITARIVDNYEKLCLASDPCKYPKIMAHQRYIKVVHTTEYKYIMSDDYLTPGDHTACI